MPDRTASAHDLVITGGRLATPMGSFEADLGIRDGRIATIGEGLSGAETIDARGKLVLPGGVEAHCHIAQESGMGIMQADDYESGSRAAALGGTTTFVPFAAKTRERTVAESLDLYAARAAGRSHIDYANHLILPDAEPETIAALPAAFARGVTALKVFTTYPKVKIDDAAFLAILSAAREAGRLTMVHAENDAMIAWMTERLMAAGLTAPKFHAPSHPALAEEEAIFRAISLARLADAPLLIVHVSTARGARLIAEARAEGVKVWGETCTQYVTLTHHDLDRPGREGAKFVCSPPPRDAAAQAALWQALRMGTLSVFSSDHAPTRFDETGKFFNGLDAPFPKIANGLPGLAARLPILFSEGVVKGRITLERFVALSATNAARLYGLAPQKGSLAIGADADIVLWDPQTTRTLRAEDLGDNTGYSPYEGMVVTGWPVLTLSRGEIIVRDGALTASAGRGRPLTPGTSILDDQPGMIAVERDAAQRLGLGGAPDR